MLLATSKVLILQNHSEKGESYLPVLKQYIPRTQVKTNLVTVVIMYIAYRYDI